MSGKTNFALQRPIGVTSFGVECGDTRPLFFSFSVAGQADRTLMFISFSSFRNTVSINNK